MTFVPLRIIFVTKFLTSRERWRRRAPWVVAIAFSASCIVHLAHPSSFTPIVPHFLAARTAIVYVSGVAEAICALGLWRRDRWAGIAAAILLVVIWPANLQMALDARGVTHQVEAWVRLPLQIPLIWCAMQARRIPRPAPTI